MVEQCLGEVAVNGLAPPDDLEGSGHSGRAGDLSGALLRVTLRPPDLEMRLGQRRVLKNVDVAWVHGRGNGASKIRSKGGGRQRQGTVGETDKITAQRS